MIRLRKVQRVGSAVGVTIPRAVLHAMGWHVGDMVLLAVRDGCAVLRRIQEAELLDHLPPAPRGGAATCARCGHARSWHEATDGSCFHVVSPTDKDACPCTGWAVSVVSA